LRIVRTGGRYHVTARFPLAELGKLAGGLGYAVVSKALARFGRRLEADPRLRQEIAAIRDRLSK
jgi:hypothetical protein